MPCQTFTLKLGIHMYSIPFHLSEDWCFFPPNKSKNEARHSLRLQSAQPTLFDSPTIALRSSLTSPFDPPISPHTRRISDFLASSRGPNLGRSFDVPLPSHQGPKLESAHEELDFEIVGIPALPFRFLLFAFRICFFLPVFQKFNF
ncbi:hypothetical protein AVEN_125855-1 [Araneus ventricosus]|uniref:Uncharacterized protein n=1 Tax=Araneus ventricosus TaxID=182803 RepID=A0A4Y2IYU1_ARAVE|nr:hypothetical protein AVEN_125855-1 [Araneus ventricosus]